MVKLFAAAFMLMIDGQVVETFLHNNRQMTLQQCEETLEKDRHIFVQAAEQTSAVVKREITVKGECREQKAPGQDA